MRGSGEGALRYEVEIDLSTPSTHTTIVELVGHDREVLELGPAGGHMSRVLRSRGCRVTAVELDPDAAARAEAHCERVVVGDLDRLDLHAELGDERFDVAVAADVLEHLRDPGAVLGALRAHLRPGGYVVASLPNVAHASIRLALLEGRFPYASVGLLDRTHLRFFTHRSALELFEQAGYEIVHETRTNRSLEESEIAVDTSVAPADLLERLRRDPDALAYQFILVAAPPGGKEPAYLHARLRQLSRENAELRASLERQTARVEEMRATRAWRAASRWWRLRELLGRRGR
jgi:2-polyprenyl-3-methyl-5-hydroxy-6-metoxy-1,4-benzoquinol methylase